MRNLRIMRAYWWKVQPNFGDYLTPFILETLLGITTEWSLPEDSEIVIVGSTIDVLPSFPWSGIIAGAGKLHERSRVPELAKVYGLRGELTAQSYGPGDYALGDPGLIVDEMVPQQERIHNLGLVPHWTDRNTKELEKRFKHLDPFVIDPAQDPVDAIAQIGSCKKIVSSSLHGIVIADAFGIPRRAERFPKINHHHEGGEFKFHDYASAIGLPMEFGTLQEPKRNRIERAQAELFDMFEDLRGVCRALEM
jgi:pyruvyltransferase